jgi:hypothetical protein
MGAADPHPADALRSVLDTAILAARSRHLDLRTIADIASRCERRTQFCVSYFNARILHRRLYCRNRGALCRRARFGKTSEAPKPAAPCIGAMGLDMNGNSTQPDTMQQEIFKRREQGVA